MSDLFKKAHAYRRKHPNATMKQACDAVRGKRVSGVKRKPAKKAPARKAAPVAKRVTIKTTTTQATVGALLGQAKRQLIVKLGDLEARKYVAKRKSDKNKLAKEIREVKAKIRKVS